MILRMYGVENLQKMIRHHIALSEWFDAAVKSDPRFEVLTPTRFGLTCFRLAGVKKAVNQQLMETVNATGEI
jgi:glutamate/tyrosine decarboxylase-like PLP-dependent enzyme